MLAANGRGDNSRRKQELAPRTREECYRHLWINYQHSFNAIRLPCCSLLSISSSPLSSSSWRYLPLPLSYPSFLSWSPHPLLRPSQSHSSHKQARSYNTSKEHERSPTPKTATLRTTLAFSGLVKAVYAVEKYPFCAGRLPSTAIRCCFGAILYCSEIWKTDSMGVEREVIQREAWWAWFETGFGFGLESEFLNEAGEVRMRFCQPEADAPRSSLPDL